MGKNRVLCEIDTTTRKLVRILRYGGTALFLRPEQVIELPKGEAVSQIRRQVFERSGGECNSCSKTITWDGFHMHEVKPRGKGGEVSTYNSIALCADCHIGKGGAHANRYPQWSLTK